MNAVQTYFLCGVGGSGMSALAQLLRIRGHRVCGSDRCYDRDGGTPIFDALARAGVALCAQDGSGVTDAVDALIVSSAVEDQVPDVRRARALGIPVKRRAELLAEVFHSFPQRIAVGGTSGKSTVTAMIAHILTRLDRAPTMVNGAAVRHAPSGGAAGLRNVLAGSPDCCVIEADESDGTIAMYDPSVAVLTNIGLDHRPLTELLPLFREFVERAPLCSVINADCARSLAMAAHAPRAVTFGIADSAADVFATEIVATLHAVRFNVDGVPCELPMPGRHNVANALAAAAAARVLGHGVGESLRALSDFPGLCRRLEPVGMTNGVAVIDDFAHNPDKMAASINAVRPAEGRTIAVFQPHGYTPLRLFGEELVTALAAALGPHDLLIMTDVYYAGGTVTRDVDPGHLVDRLCSQGGNARFIARRDDVIPFVAGRATVGDCVLVMGARDPSLREFADRLLAAIAEAKQEGAR